MTITFKYQQTFAAGSGVNAVATADVNRDGKLDLVVTNVAGSNVSVLLGNGDGTFQAQKTFGVGSIPLTSSLADVNRDGKLDLITSNFGSNNVSVLLGNGDGTFQAQRTLAAGAGTSSVALADVDGDGKLDLFTTNYNQNTFSVLLGNGDGTFKAHQTTGVGSQPSAVTLADVNKDGKLDLVVTTFATGIVSVMLGNGNGAFQAQETFGIGAGPRAVAIADFDRDGNLDIATANVSDKTVSVLLGNGNGTFKTQHSISIDASDGPTSVTSADVDGDGKLDLVVTESNATSMSVLLGNGNGTFQASQTFGTGTSPHSAAVADFNGDGKLDLVSANNGAGNVSVLLGAQAVGITAVNASQASGAKLKAGDQLTLSLTPEAPVEVDTTGGTPYLTLSNGKQAAYTGSDTNGNPAFTYTVAAGDDTTSLKVTGLTLNGGLIGMPGVNGFSPSTTDSITSNPVAVTSADVNGDGNLDLITVNKNGGAASVLLGNGNGSFQAERTFPAGYSDFMIPASVSTADMNRDGKLDIVYSAIGYSAVGVLLGNGDGTFQQQKTMGSGGGSNTTDPKSVAVADVDRDGKPDLVTANFGGDSVSILLGNGNGTLRFSQTISTGAGSKPTSVAVADLTGDGRVELVTANSGNNTLSVLIDDGNGNFSTRQDLDTGSNSAPSMVTMADFNGDGKQDLLALLAGKQTAKVWLGAGNGTFVPQQDELPTGLNPASIAARDLNGDGKLDVLIANKDSKTLSLFLGKGDGTFLEGFAYSVGSAPGAMTTGDVNGDGRPDVLMTDENGKTVSVRLNFSSAGAELNLANLSTATGADTGVVVDTIAPTVTGVSASTANGTYKTGDTISLQVGFSEAVTVTGTPQLTLATGGTGRAVDYASGSGSKNLTFTYTVQAGDTAADLDVVATNALALNGGTITDAAGNAATLTLAAPGAAGSLGAAKAITVDTTAPTVTGVSASTADGTYKAGDTISLQVGFSEAVTVTGTPQLTLATGGTGRAVDYTSGSGTNSLTFTYTVQAGDTSADLDVLATTALALNGGTITDAAGNAAALTLAAPGTAGSLGAAKAIVIDTTAPDAPVITTPVAGTLTNDSTPTITGTAEAGSKVQILVDGRMAGVTMANDAGVFSIEGPKRALTDGPHTISAYATDAAGNQSADSASVGLTVDTTPPTAPRVTSGTAYTTITPTLTGVAEANATVTIKEGATLLGTVTANADGTWSLPGKTFAAGAHTLALTATDAAGNASTTTFALTTSQPFGFTGASATRQDPRSGPLKAGDSLAITLATAQTVTGVTLAQDGARPSLTLSNGATASYAGFDASGLQFTYTVQVGDDTADLTASSLALAGATIEHATPDGFQTSSSTGTDLSRSAEAADVDGDGKLDLITTGYNGGTVSVRLGNGDGTFKGETKHATGVGPTAVAAADLNGDGKVDLVTANDTAGHNDTVSVLLGNGDGTFRSKLDFAVGENPYAVMTADVNGDGKRDLLTVNQDDDTVSVLLGNGDGTFQAKAAFETGAFPTAVAAADLNRDGKIDLVAANTDEGEGTTVSVLLGNGDGTFQTKVDFTTGAAPRAVTAVDVNGDGKHDLVVANRSGNSVSVLLGNGDGTFQAKADFAVGKRPGAVAAVDVDQDGKIDLVTANRTNNDISVLLGNGDGTFRAGTSYMTGTTPYSLTATDLNADGRPDFLVSTTGDNGITVLLSTLPTRALLDSSSLAATSLSVAVDTTAPGAPVITTPVAGTLTNDSTPTITGTAEAGSEITILIDGNPIRATTASETGTFTFELHSALIDGAHTISARATDAAGNTSADATPVGLTVDATAPAAPRVTSGSHYTTTAPTLTGVAEANATVTIKEGATLLGTVTANADGTWSLPGKTFAAGAHTLALTATDAAGNASTTTFALTTSQPFGFTGASATRQQPGSGPLKAGDSLAITLATAQTVTGVTLAQGGAQPSLTLSNGATASYAGFNASGLQFTYTVQVGDDTADLTASSLALAGATVGHGTQVGFQTSVYTGADLGHSATAADVDGDGKLDLIASGYEGGTVSVRLGNGDGTFKTETKHAAGNGPASVAAADLNGDGKIDLVTSNFDAASVSVLLGNGDGTFQAKTDFAVRSMPAMVTAADVDGDGTRDLIVPSFGGGSVLILRGNGDGTFQTISGFETGSQPTAVAAADLNGDGKIDLATTALGTSSVSVELGNGDGTFRTKADIPVGSAPSAVVAADVNGDGKRDLVVANRDSASVSVLLGNGDGTFQAKTDFATGFSPSSVAAADINQDGKLDLVTANGASSDVSVLLGNGDGTFQAEMPFKAGKSPWSMTTSDLNGDGRPDLVVGTFGQDGVAVLLNAPTAQALLDSSSFTATSLSVAVDTVAPDAPVITAPTAGALTKNTTPTITGTAEAGSTVAVTVGGATYTTTATGGAWSLDLATAIPASGTLALDRNGANAVAATATDAAGNVSAAGTQSLVIDAIAPTVTGLGATTPDGTYKAGDTISLQVGFSEAVTVTGTPQLTLATGGTGRAVDYTSGSGTNSLTFTYTVQAGDTSADLDVLATTALALNGGTITDAAGNAAALTLAAPGTAGSLGAAKAIVIDTTADSGNDAAVTVDAADGLVTAGQAAAVAFQVSGLDPDATAQLRFSDGTRSTSVAVSRNGSGTADLSALTGAVTTTLVISDQVGNTATVNGPALTREAAPQPVKPTVDGATVDTSTSTAADGSLVDTVSIAAPDATRVEDGGTPNADLADVPVVRETLTDPRTGQATSLATLTVSVPTGVGVVATGSAGRQTPVQALTGLTGLIAAIQARTEAGSASQTDLTGGGQGFLGALSSQAQLLVRTVEVRAPGVAPGQPVQMRVNGNTLGGTGTGSATPTALVFDTTAVADPVTVRLDNVEFAAVVGNATLVGGDGRQVVYGDANQQYLYLGADDDVLHGGGGNDTVASAAGNDTLSGDAGEDSVLGGEGNDSLLGGTGRDTVFGETGDDEVYGQDDDDFLGAGAGNDFGSGGYGNDEVHGEAGDDLLFGDEGRDGVYGEDGDDWAYGGTGDDVVLGGAGRDVVFGQDGDDLVRGEAGDDFVSGGYGRDRVEGGSGNDLVYGDDDDDDVSGGDGDDQVHGGTGNGRVSGDAGIDVVLGEQGDDTLTGGADGDGLSGGEGADLVSGDDGSDLLFGNAGDDTLVGGSGSDIFAFGQGDGSDVVRDFVVSGPEADVIGFNGGVLGSFAAVQAALTQVGSDTVIRYGTEDTVTLQGVQAASLGAANFTFT